HGKLHIAKSVEDGTTREIAIIHDHLAAKRAELVDTEVDESRSIRADLSRVRIKKKPGIGAGGIQEKIICENRHKVRQLRPHLEGQSGMVRKRDARSLPTDKN